MARPAITLEVVVPMEGDVSLCSNGGNPVISSTLAETDYLCGSCNDVIISGDPGPPIEVPDGGRLLVTCAKCGKDNLFPL
jgi:hypothetical protein